MPPTWYVTFAVQKRGVLPKRRSPRVTKTFETEIEAKNFARAKFNEGVIVFAGTIKLISSANIPFWLEGEQEQETAKETAKPDGAQSDEK